MALQQLDKSVVPTGNHFIEFSIVLPELANVAPDGEAINAFTRRDVTGVKERQGHRPENIPPEELLPVLASCGACIASRYLTRRLR